MTSNVNTNCIVLYDSESNIDELKKFIVDSNPLIITFNLNSHNFLVKNNINHELSDNYLNKNDLDDIQDRSYEFTKWYSDPKISQLVEYDAINIGELFYVEFCYFLTPILKKLYEIMRISSKFNTSSFISSKSLSNFIKIFSNDIQFLNINPENNSTIKNNKNSKFNTNSILDKIFVKYTPFILKNIYSIYNLIFEHKKINHNQPTILLINQSTRRFENLLHELPNFPINLIKYDTTIPAFWNLKSLQIIKKSSCNIEHSSKFSSNSKFEKNKMFNLKLKNFLENDEFFNTFFSLDGYSFWNIIKDNFIQMYKKSYFDAILDVEKIKLLFKKYTPSYIIVNSECSPLDLIVIKIAKKSGIKVGLSQHCLLNDDLENSNYYSSKFDQFHRSYPVYSDNFLVWDKLTEKTALTNGVDPKKIIPIGYTFFDKFFNDDENIDNLKNEYILLAITPTTNQNTSRELSLKLQLEYEDIIREICKITTKMNKKLMVKVHHGAFFDKTIIKKINPNIIIKDKGDFYQYVQNCELLICIEMSTAIIDAMLLKKPIVSILIRDKDSKSKVFVNNYTIKSNILNIEKTLSNIFYDDAFKKSYIKKGENFLENYLLNPGNSTKKLLNFLMDYK